MSTLFDDGHVEVPPKDDSETGLGGLPWIGAKSARSTNPAGRWIAQILPVRRHYIEPYAGMLGVLLQRPPVVSEVASDTDGLLMNWWTVVRDHPAELERLLYYSPRWSAGMFDEAVLKLDSEPDPIRQAYWLTISLLWGFSNKRAKPTLSRRWHSTCGQARSDIGPRLAGLSARVRNVQLETLPALDILGRVESLTDCVTYCDPPYRRSASHGFYENTDYEREKLTAALRAQAGYVAISGYGTEWDHLEWRRRELPVQTYWASRRSDRLEVLWTNEK